MSKTFNEKLWDVLIEQSQETNTLWQLIEDDTKCYLSLTNGSYWEFDKVRNTITLAPIEP